MSDSVDSADIDEQLINEECIVLIDRIDIDLQSFNKAPPFQEIPEYSNDYQSYDMSKISKKRVPDYEAPGPKSKSKKSKVFEYVPDEDNINFIPLDASRYKMIKEIVPPMYSDATSDLCCFVLSKSISKKINVDNYCILLRFAFFTKQDSAYEDVFDGNFEVSVNNVVVPLTLTNEENVNVFITGPADITRYVIAEGESTEKIKINLTSTTKPHIFSIVLAERKYEELPHIILRYCEPFQTFKLALKGLDATDSNIKRRTFSLLDPSSGERMELPCRGLNCIHAECFDKKVFLKNNLRKPVWTCPICSKPIKDDELVVDGLFSKVLAKSFLSCTRFELDNFGNWAPLYRGKVFRLKTIDLDNDDSDEEANTEDPLSPENYPEGENPPEINSIEEAIPVDNTIENEIIEDKNEKPNDFSKGRVSKVKMELIDDTNQVISEYPSQYE